MTDKEKLSLQILSHLVDKRVDETGCATYRPATFKFKCLREMFWNVTEDNFNECIGYMVENGFISDRLFKSLRSGAVGGFIVCTDIGVEHYLKGI